MYLDYLISHKLVGRFTALCKQVLKVSALLVFVSTLICCHKPDSSSKAPQKVDPLLFKSATELTGSIRRGEITSLDLLNKYIDSIQRNNDRINAVVSMNIDAARAMAAEADKALSRGQDWGHACHVGRPQA